MRRKGGLAHVCAVLVCWTSAGVAAETPAGGRFVAQAHVGDPVALVCQEGVSDLPGGLGGGRSEALADERIVERWRSSASEALDLLTDGEPGLALRALRVSEALFSDRVVLTVPANERLDVCLFRVRALWELGRAEKAKDQAAECRRLVPAGSPSARRHPPEVEQFLGLADAAVHREGAVLSVDGPVGCTVVVNGTSSGKTPKELSVLPGEYRVSVVCEEASPVWVVRARADKAAQVYADPALVESFRVEPCPHFVFSGATSFRRQRERIEAGIRALSGATDVEWVSVASELSQQERVDDPRRRLRTGRATLALGGATGVGAWVFTVLRGGKGDALKNAVPGEDGFADAQRAWWNYRYASIALAAATPALLAVGGGLSRSGRELPLVARWSMLGAGVAGVAVGAYFVATGARCDLTRPTTGEELDACVDDEQRRDLGWAAAATGLGLTLVPLTRLEVREAKTQLSVGASESGGARVSWSGVF